MTIPIQITFGDIPHSNAVKDHLEEKVNKLQKYCHKMVSCHVVLELATKNQHSGNLHNTRLTVVVPGKELVTKKNEDEDLYRSIRDAFDDMARQLEDYARQTNGQDRNHQSLITGEVVRLFPNDGFGFIQTADGTEFYFNAKHVANPSFGKLSVGMTVHFTSEEGHDGPQAHHVREV